MPQWHISTICAPAGVRTPNDGSEDRSDIQFHHRSKINKISSLDGIRTRVTRMKTWRPRPD